MRLWMGLVFILFFIFEILVFENILLQMVLFFTTKSLYIGIFYTLVTLLGFLSLTLFMFVEKRRYFFLFMLLLFLTYSIDLTYKNINQLGFFLTDLSVAVAQMNSFGLDALTTYGQAIQEALLVLVALFFLLYLLRRFIVVHKFYLSLKWAVSMFLLTLALSFLILFKTTGATKTRPTLFKVIDIGIYYLFSGLYYGEREVLTQKPTSLEKYKNIIFILDESVGGSYLSINGYEKETTPYLKRTKEEYINLGIASSAANCSSKSNLILMSGIQLNELPDKENRALKTPTIFQYAKNAGYKTHYISGQSMGMFLQNHITKYDLKYIDTFYQPETEGEKEENIPEENIVNETVKALNSSDKNFIFMVKRGAHFQWEESYPLEEKYFTPTLKSSDALMLEKKEEAVNSYLNAVRYNVDLFFQEFLKSIHFKERKDTLIIYTSDHGQSILEKGRVSTHCDSSNPPLSQGVIPLLLFTSEEDRTVKTFNFKKDIYSHFEIFPTIQKFMGYEQVKGETLFEIDEHNSNQTFVSGDIFGRVTFEQNDIGQR